MASKGGEGKENRQIGLKKIQEGEKRKYLSFFGFFDCQKRRERKHLVLALRESFREFIHFLKERVEALVICLGWKPSESSLCTFSCAFTCFFLVTSFRLVRKFLSICNHVLFVSLMEICLVHEYDAFFILGVIYSIFLFFFVFISGCMCMVFVSC